jgi:hypothetical protein
MISVNPLFFSRLPARLDAMVFTRIDLQVALKSSATKTSSQGKDSLQLVISPDDPDLVER